MNVSQSVSLSVCGEKLTDVWRRHIICFEFFNPYLRHSFLLYNFATPSCPLPPPVLAPVSFFPTVTPVLTPMTITMTTNNAASSHTSQSTSPHSLQNGFLPLFFFLFPPNLYLRVDILDQVEEILTGTQSHSLHFPLLFSFSPHLQHSPDS